MAETQVVDLIVDALVAHLITALQTNVDSDDPTHADVVKAGRFLDDPKQNAIHVAVHGGDPEKLEYIDGIVSIEDFKQIGLQLFSREVGGGVAWWRRGICQFGCFFVENDQEEDVARAYAYEFYGRIQANIENLTVSNLTDDFGEQASKMFLTAATMHPSGGAGKWIWRGKIFWQCLTYKG